MRRIGLHDRLARDLGGNIAERATGGVSIKHSALKQRDLRGCALSSSLQAFECLLESSSRITLVLCKCGLGHGIATPRNVVAVDIQSDERLDVELLFSDSVFVRVLVESNGDELNDHFFSARDQRNNEQSEQKTLEDVEIREGCRRGVSYKGVLSATRCQRRKTSNSAIHSQQGLE